MTKLFHIAALAVGLTTLIAISSSRHLENWPNFELLSYFALIVGSIELRSIIKNGPSRQTPARFSVAMTLIVFCLWTGGSPFVGMEEQTEAALLFGAAGFFWLVSWIVISASSNTSKKSTEQAAP